MDVLVELSVPLGLAFFDIQLALQRWLGRPVDLGTWDSLHPGCANGCVRRRCVRRSDRERIEDMMAELLATSQTCAELADWVREKLRRRA